MTNWDTTRQGRHALRGSRHGFTRNGHVFFDMTTAPGEEALDGMKVDRAGNLFVSGPGGVWIISAEGRHLGTIRAPELPANMAWGDADGRDALHDRPHQRVSDPIDRPGDQSKHSAVIQKPKWSVQLSEWNCFVAPRHSCDEIVRLNPSGVKAARNFDRSFAGLIRESAGSRPHNELALLPRRMLPDRSAGSSSRVSATRDRRNDPRGAAQNGLAFQASQVSTSSVPALRPPGACGDGSYTKVGQCRRTDNLRSLSADRSLSGPRQDSRANRKWSPTFSTGMFWHRGCCCAWHNARTCPGAGFSRS